MLNKLLKYDLKWIDKIVIIFYIITLIVALLTRFIGTLEKTIIIVILEKILVGTFISLCVNIVINTFMRIWARFRINLYKDESYLTHTLPVTKAQIFNAKVISTFITTITSILIILICFLLVYLNNTTLESLKVLYDKLVDVYGNFGTNTLIISTIFMIILEFTFMIFSGIFGIVLGHRFNNYKLLKSILIGFLSYIGFSLLTLLIIYLIALNNPTVMELYKIGIPSPESISLLIYVTLLIYAIYNLFYYIICKMLLAKGVNVD